MAMTKHLLGVCGAYISVDVWNKIPEEYRTIMQEEFTKGAETMVKNISEGEEATKQKLETEMGISFNDVDNAAFAELVAPIYDNMKDVTPVSTTNSKKQLLICQNNGTSRGRSFAPPLFIVSYRSPRTAREVTRVPDQRGRMV